MGFGGEAKVWGLAPSSGDNTNGSSGDGGGSQESAVGEWRCKGLLKTGLESKKAGEVWAVALDEEGRYLAGTTADGRINVWDLANHAESDAGNTQGNTEKKAGEVAARKIREFETKGSFGLCIDMVSAASYGHC